MSETSTEVIYRTSHKNGALEEIKSEEIRNEEVSTKSSEYKLTIKWLNVLVFIYLHGAAVYSFFLRTEYWSTLAIAWIYSIGTGLGTTVASHRYFTHKTFKANKKLRTILIYLQTACAQEPILNWARDHRVHHKFTDTDADPYNSRRGFFFAHMGWLMCKKHPEVIKQGNKIDMSDLENDPMLQFQKKYFMPLALFANFAVPISLGYLCGESLAVLWYGNIYRYLIMLHLVWTVNSVAHFFGDKPFDKNISPADSWYVGFWALGEGWHNYHHVFPWDYKTAELPGYGLNISTAFIDFFAWLGWATELKTVPDEIIKKRVLRTGDGSHPYSKEIDVNNNSYGDKLRDTEHFWGWGDKEMTTEDIKYVKVL